AAGPPGTAGPSSPCPPTHSYPSSPPASLTPATRTMRRSPPPATRSARSTPRPASSSLHPKRSGTGHDADVGTNPPSAPGTPGAAGGRQVKRAVARAGQGKLRGAELVTHRFALEDIPTAVQVVRDRDGAPVKVVVLP